MDTAEKSGGAALPMLGRLLKSAGEFSVSLQQAIPEVPPLDLKPIVVALYAPFEAQLSRSDKLPLYLRLVFLQF